MLGQFLVFFFFPPPEEIVLCVAVDLVCLWEEMSLGSSFVAILNWNLTLVRGDKSREKIINLKDKDQFSLLVVSVNKWIFSVSSILEF